MTLAGETAVTDPRWLDRTADPKPIASGPALHVRHRLAGMPEFGWEAALRLARQLPAPMTRCSGPGRPLLMTAGSTATPATLSAAAAADGLASNGHAIRLYHLEVVPGYRSLISSLLSELAPLVSTGKGEDEPGGRPGEGSLFLAAPGAVTPVHCDKPHNFLLQVVGRKEFSLGFFDDPDERQRQIEHTGLNGGAPSAMPSRVETMILGPGDGVYIPPLSFHWVRILDEPSLAVSCAFATQATERNARVHLFNRRARSIGLPLRPPGTVPSWDAFRDIAVRVGERMKRLRTGR